MLRSKEIQARGQKKTAQEQCRRDPVVGCCSNKQTGTEMWCCGWLWLLGMLISHLWCLYWSPCSSSNCSFLLNVHLGRQQVMSQLVELSASPFSLAQSQLWQAVREWTTKWKKFHTHTFSIKKVLKNSWENSWFLESWGRFPGGHISSDTQKMNRSHKLSSWLKVRLLEEWTVYINKAWEVF